MLHGIPQNTLGLTCRCVAQEQASDIKVLQEKVTNLTETEGQLRRHLEAEQTDAKVLRLALTIWM